MIPPSLLHRPFLPIASERLTLRPFEECDASALAALANDRRVAEKLMRLSYPYHVEDAQRYIVYAQEGLQKGAHVCLAIVRRADQTLMGVVGLEETLGYWLGVKFWGQGYGKEAVKAFVHFAFSVLLQDTLTASVLLENKRSQKILKGLGFKQIGTKQNHSKAYEGSKPAAIYILSQKDFLDHYNAIPRPLVWVITAALINDNGKLLLAERPAGKVLAGVWELPGGKMEEGETLEQTLIRELKEELHITVRDENLEPLTFVSYRYDTFHLIMPLYLCRKWEGEPYGAEGQKLAWVSYQDLAHMPLPPADILPAHRLADILKSLGIWDFP